jgi:hypothetical protein
VGLDSATGSELCCNLSLAALSTKPFACFFTTSLGLAPSSVASLTALLTYLATLAAATISVFSVILPADSATTEPLLIAA